MREDRLDDDQRRAPHNDLLARVERICRLREADGTEIRRGPSGRFDYLSVTSTEGEGIFKDFAIGAVDDVTSERFDAFFDIHRRYRHADSGVVSTLVYAGAPASDDSKEYDHPPVCGSWSIPPGLNTSGGMGAGMRATDTGYRSIRIDSP
jgi:hypothetical protein